MSLAEFAPVLDAARGLAWPARRRVRSVVAGPNLSVARGTTDEFVEYRPYRQGDDPRRIDWKLVARTDRVYVRVSQQRAVLPTMLVLDASASMAFPPPANAKWDLARRLTIGLAAMARHSGDPVGLAVAHPDGTRRVEPRTRLTVVEQMMRAVAVAPGGTAPVAAAAEEAMRRAARVAVVSDFLDDAEAILARGRTFVAAGGELYVIHVVDRLELDPDARMRLVDDPEAPTVRRPLSPRARAEYQRRFAEWRDRLAGDCWTSGALYTMVVTGHEPIRQTMRRVATPGAGAPRLA